MIGKKIQANGTGGKVARINDPNRDLSMFIGEGNRGR